MVALHPEGVDRNVSDNSMLFSAIAVALHPEGVDRNFEAYCELLYNETVALHPEGVDRNTQFCKSLYALCSRPPPGGRG